MNREVELGSHGELDSLLLPVSTVGALVSVFVTVFRTAIQFKEQVAEYTSCFPLEQHLLVWWWLTVGLSCFCGSEHVGPAIHWYLLPPPLPPPPPRPPSPPHSLLNGPFVVSEDVKAKQANK